MNAIIPDRISTSVGRTSIAFPHALYCGDPEQYDFKRMKGKYQALKEVLARNNLKFEVVGASKVGTNERFVAVVGTLEQPLLMWERYVGMSSQSGQSHLYFLGECWKVTDFLAKSAVEQDALLGSLTLKAFVLGLI